MINKTNEEKFKPVSEGEMKEIKVPSSIIASAKGVCSAQRTCADGSFISCITDAGECSTKEGYDEKTGKYMIYVTCGKTTHSCIGNPDGGSGSGSGGEKPTEPTDPVEPVEPVPSGSETDKTPDSGNGALL